MTKLIGIVCCMVVLCIPMSAQDRLEMKGNGYSRKFRLGTKEAFQSAGAYRMHLRPVLNGNETSRKMFIKSHRMKVSGDILAIAGGAGLFMIFTLPDSRRVAVKGVGFRWPPEDQYIGLKIGAASLLSLLLGGLCNLTSRTYLHESVRLYNSQVDERLPADHMGGADIRLGITPHGVGMVMSW